MNLQSGNTELPADWVDAARADPEWALDKAMELHDSGCAEASIPLLRAALQSHPRHARLWQTAGVIHRALEDFEAARAEFVEAARLAPSDAKIAYGLAQVSMEVGLPAFELFERARMLAPANGGLLRGRAAAQLAEGRAAAAVSDLDTILKMSPLWLDGHETLSRIRYMMGQGTGSTASLERALASEPRQISLWTSLIDTLIEIERFADADAAINRARAVLPDATALLLQEAICASELGDTARADRLFEMIRHRPEMAIAVRHIRHLLRTGRADAAATRIEPLLSHAEAEQIWPYASIAWRLTADRRWQWLEGDPRLIGVYDLGVTAGDLAALAQRLRMLHVSRTHPLGQSVRGGTQTDGPLFARGEPEIRALRRVIVDTVRSHRDSLPALDPRHPFLRHRPEQIRFTGSWSVKLGGSGHHNNHLHPQGWLSSVFYVAIPDSAQLGPMPAGWLTLGVPPMELGLDLKPFRQVEPQAGRLVLFPSLMWHGTMPFADGERLTVAFDVAGRA